MRKIFRLCVAALIIGVLSIGAIGCEDGSPPGDPGPSKGGELQ